MLLRLKRCHRPDQTARLFFFLFFVVTIDDWLNRDLLRRKESPNSKSELLLAQSLEWRLKTLLLWRLLPMNVAGVVKDWLLIAFSWSMIKDTVTPINLFGYGLAFLGVGYYNHCKLQALKAKDAQKKVQENDEEAGKLLEERESEAKQNETQD